MAVLTDQSLLEILACPECGNALHEKDRGLSCIACSAHFEVRGGIPLLYPSDMDMEHMHEEEHLAELMHESPQTETERFRKAQWVQSKQEFWKIVRDEAGPAPKTFVNLGCGLDTNFVYFEQQGYRFINFDMVYSMLQTLQTDRAARSCVAGDIGKLPFRKGSVDYVVCIDVIHHEIDRISDLIKSFGALLKPGGQLFLEDPNSWALFQIPKSILPRFMHGQLRSAYHRIRKADHKPADYEFPTSVWKVQGILRDLGFEDITVHPNAAYPCTPALYRIYRQLSRIRWVTKFHNYHYSISAKRPSH